MEGRLRGALLVVLVAAIAWVPRSAFGNQAAQDKPAAGGESHGVLLVELSKPLNSKNLQAGSVVEARVHGGQNGMSIPRDSKVVGHVTEAKSRSKGDSESALKIVFDSINPPGAAKPTTISAVIKAVAPNPNSGIDTGGGGVAYSNLNEATQRAGAGSSPTPSSTPLLNEQSTGVKGIKNLELGDDGLLTSGGKEVKLDGGTQLLLNVTIQ